jgi:AcrR family transcriptional regulator
MVQTMPTASVRTAGRLTQPERSAATRARLLDATLDCLVELGWARTSTTEVVRRAGVSRGAQVHHFPTKEDLVLATVEHLMARRLDEYRQAFGSLPEDQRTPEAGFDLLRAACSGPTWVIWLELAVASRTNPALRERFVEVGGRFWDAAVQIQRDLFPFSAGDEAFARLVVQFAFCFVDGMSLARLVGADEAELDAVADAFKLVTAPFTTGPAQGGSSS